MQSEVKWIREDKKRDKPLSVCNANDGGYMTNIPARPNQGQNSALQLVNQETNQANHTVASTQLRFTALTYRMEEVHTEVTKYSNILSFSSYFTGDSMPAVFMSG